MISFKMKDILSLVDSDIRNQYGSSIASLYPDVKFNSPTLM